MPCKYFLSLFPLCYLSLRFSLRFRLRFSLRFSLLNSAVSYLLNTMLGALVFFLRIPPWSCGIWGSPSVAETIESFAFRFGTHIHVCGSNLASSEQIEMKVHSGALQVVSWLLLLLGWSGKEMWAHQSWCATSSTSTSTKLCCSLLLTVCVSPCICFINPREEITIFIIYE